MVLHALIQAGQARSVSIAQAMAMQVIRLYDRRITIEEQFRDTKGSRFGAKLKWTQFKRPDQLSWMLRLVAVALLVWILTGKRQATRSPSFLWTCAQKGPRLSWVTIGLFIYTHLPFGQAVGPPLTLRRLRRQLPKQTLRPLASFLGGAK